MWPSFVKSNIQVSQTISGSVCMKYTAWDKLEGFMFYLYMSGMHEWIHWNMFLLPPRSCETSIS